MKGGGGGKCSRRISRGRGRGAAQPQCRPAHGTARPGLNGGKGRSKACACSRKGRSRRGTIRRLGRDMGRGYRPGEGRESGARGQRASSGSGARRTKNHADERGDRAEGRAVLARAPGACRRRAPSGAARSLERCGSLTRRALGQGAERGGAFVGAAWAVDKASALQGVGPAGQPQGRRAGSQPSPAPASGGRCEAASGSSARLTRLQARQEAR